MAYDTLYIGGGFDILHVDHKDFIKRCIDAYSAEYCQQPRLIIKLFSNDRLNSTKGVSRPFFSYEWREMDICNFLQSKNFDFQIIKTTSLITGSESIIKDKAVIVLRKNDTKTGAFFESKGFRIILVSSVDKFHTTDIEKRLLTSKEKSNCKIRKVGALLERYGEIVKEGYSGNGDCNCYSKYKVYSVAGKASQNIPCDFPHAEEVCLEDVKKGDDLFITCSPCMACAEKIVSKGVRRVVFLEEYYDVKPLEYLRKNGVQFRKAGLV